MKENIKIKLATEFAIGYMCGKHHLRVSKKERTQVLNDFKALIQLKKLK